MLYSDSMVLSKPAIKADSICVHGDNPKALEFVKNIRETLIAEGVEIKNLSL